MVPQTTSHPEIHRGPGIQALSPGPSQPAIVLVTDRAVWGPAPEASVLKSPRGSFLRLPAQPLWRAELSEHPTEDRMWLCTAV